MFLEDIKEHVKPPFPRLLDSFTFSFVFLERSWRGYRNLGTTKLSNLVQMLLWHSLDFKWYCFEYKWDRTWSTRELTICLADVGLAILHFQVVLKTRLTLQKHKNMFTNKLWCSLLATVLQMRSPFFKWEQTSFLLIHMNYCFWTWVGTCALSFRRKGVLQWTCPHKSSSTSCSVMSAQLPSFTPGSLGTIPVSSTGEWSWAKLFAKMRYMRLFWGACR